MKTLPPGLKTLLVAALSLVILGALVLIGTAVINIRVVPSLAAQAASRIEARTGFKLIVGSARYRFPAAVRLRNIELQTSERLTPVTIREALIRIDLRGFLFHRRQGGWVDRLRVRDLSLLLSPEMILRETAPGDALPDTAESSAPADATATVDRGQTDSPAFSVGNDLLLWDLIDTIAGTSLLPRIIILESGTLAWDSSSGRASLMSRFSGRLEHDAVSRVFNFAFEGTAGGGGVIDYGRRSFTGSLQIPEIEAHTLNQLLSREYRLLEAGILACNLSLNSPLPGVAELSGSIEAKDLVVSHPAMGDAPFSGIAMSYDFSATYDAEAPLPPPRILGRVTGSNPSVIAQTQAELREQVPPARGELLVRKGSARVNGIDFEIRPTLRGLFRGPGPSAQLTDIGMPVRVDLQLELPPVDTQAIVEALPAELLGPFEGLKLSGRFSWNLDLEVPLDSIAEMNWIAVTDLTDFKVVAIPEAFNVYRLDDEFAYIFPDESRGYQRMLLVPAARSVSLDWMYAVSERTPRQIARAREFERTQSGKQPRLVPSPGLPAFGEAGGAVKDPGNRYYRLEEISPWIPKAVLTTEDGDFFFHEGINWFSFKNAVERNFKAGEIELGASTITMQLAKNLFLSLDRAFLRKAHESFLVYLIERDAGISKERILELYLNIAQFGPNIYGVDHASRHYFGKSPADLSATEAVWLASVLPSPVRYHRYYEAGAISDGWFELMKGILAIMLERERMNEEEFEAAVQDRPRFVNVSH